MKTHRDERRPLPMWQFRDSGAVCGCPDLLTYLLEKAILEFQV